MNNEHTIMVATDFSEAASNAVRYAVQLAKDYRLRLVLVHVHTPSYPATELPVTDQEGTTEAVKQRLAQLAASLDPDQAAGISYLFCSGAAVHELLAVTREQRPELLVMGMKGNSLLNELLMGSTTTAVIKASAVPVLVIPGQATYKKPAAIAFACDYKLNTGLAALDSLRKLVQPLGAKLLVVNVLMEKESAALHERALTKTIVKHYLADLACSYHDLADLDFVPGLNAFITAQGVDILAMIPYKHNLAQRIFAQSHTRRMVFHTHVPLLTLPDNL